MGKNAVRELQMQYSLGIQIKRHFVVDTKCSQVYNALLHMDVPQLDFQIQIHEGVVQDNWSQKYQEFYMMFYKLV